MSSVPVKARNYIFGLAILSALLMGYVINQYHVDDWMMVLVLSILAVVAETFLVQLPGIGAISVTFAITFAAIIVGGPLAAIIVGIAGMTFCRPYVEGRGYIHFFNTPPIKTLFNVSQNILYTGTAGIAYVLIHNQFLSFDFIDPFSVIGSMAVFITVNTLCMTALIFFLQGGKFTHIWFENFRGTNLSVFAVSLLGILVAIAYNSYGPGAVVLFFVPLMLSRYSFKLYVDMRKNYYDTVKALINAIEAKDPYTSGHASRVGEYAVAIANEMDMSPKQIEVIKNAALLHDIGKIGINDNILNKKDRLSDLELEVIKNHPSIGYDIIKDVGFLGEVMEIVKHHHERWDGGGYPDGISKEKIPIETCVLTIADAYDAMTTDRPYRKALSPKEAIDEIQANMGTQFNPNLWIATQKALVNITDNIEEDQKK
jgi:putative nucleotidyltransferase with HDIG domain